GRSQLFKVLAFFWRLSEGLRTQHYCGGSSVLLERHGVLDFQWADFAKRCPRDAALFVRERIQPDDTLARDDLTIVKPSPHRALADKLHRVVKETARPEI